MNSHPAKAVQEEGVATRYRRLCRSGWRVKILPEKVTERVVETRGSTTNDVTKSATPSQDHWSLDEKRDCIFFAVFAMFCFSNHCGDLRFLAV
ncbi:hypothetical protein E2542_SST23019 [Spatholobus suberectus]|nr:hypothetical protein E2542_SST23019 [Spatholobus suberectus]